MYGICLFLGIVLAVLLGERLVKNKKLDPDTYWRAVFFTILFGVVGARLYHVLDNIGYYIASPSHLPAVWEGGLGIWGGIVGGFIGLYLSLRRNKDLVEYFDIFALCAPLAQAVGRWGNYFNYELFGFPTKLPWGLFIPAEFRPARFIYYQRFHPLFLYESLLNIILFVYMYRRYKKSESVGKVTLMYLMGYSLIRVSLEFLRPDPWMIFVLPVAFIISFVVFSVSLVLYFSNTPRTYKHPQSRTAR